MWQRWLFLFSSVVFSGGAWAGQEDNGCNKILANQEFVVTETIENYQPDGDYDLFFKKNDEVWVWGTATGNGQSPTFLEESLITGQDYQIRITYKNNKATYYRKAPNSTIWVEIQSVSTSFDSGNSDIYVSTESNSSDLYCNTLADDDIPDTPSEMPDTCDYVPSTLQTTNFTQNEPKTPFGTLTINEANAPDYNKVFLPNKAPLAFLAASNKYCYYPDTNTDGEGEPCLIDPTAAMPDSYPIVLAGRDLT